MKTMNIRIIEEREMARILKDFVANLNFIHYLYFSYNILKSCDFSVL
jgi:hypothetical protein